MATGLPCIATGWSGESEFFDEKVGYPLKYRLAEAPVRSWIHGDLGMTTVAFPDVDNLAKQMYIVNQDYKSALAIGKAASIRIKSRFSWHSSANKLVSSMKEVLGGT
jgi:glycosyltransferase involved in cell wall biosynthesis